MVERALVLTQARLNDFLLTVRQEFERSKGTFEKVVAWLDKKVNETLETLRTHSCAECNQTDVTFTHLIAKLDIMQVQVYGKTALSGQIKSRSISSNTQDARRRDVHERNNADLTHRAERPEVQINMAQKNTFEHEC